MRKYLFNETKMDSIKIFKQTKMKGVLEIVLEKAEDERLDCTQQCLLIKRMPNDK